MKNVQCTGMKFDVLRELLPHVEEIYADMFDSYTSPPALATILQAAVTTLKALRTVSLTADSEKPFFLVSLLYTTLYSDGNDGSRVSLKKFEFGVCYHPSIYRDCIPSAMEDLVQLIIQQKEMETLVIDNFITNEITDVRCLHYNYLPHFIAKSCFRLLHIQQSKITCNSMESMITAFLNNPTCHEQSLLFLICDVIDKNYNTLSSECRLQESEEFGLYQVTEKRCVAGEHKSLSVPGGEPLFPLHWLADYPGLRLKRLDIQVIVPRDAETQAAKFGGTREALDLLGGTLDTLCVTFIVEHIQSCHGSACEVLRPCLSELRFLIYHNMNSRGRNGILTVLSSSLQNAKSLSVVGFMCKGRYDSCLNAKYFIPFFNALFSLPSHQLANLTLDVAFQYVENRDIFFRASIVDTWKQKAYGQKIKSIVCRPAFSMFQDMTNELQ